MELVITNIANGSEGIGRYLILIYIISHYTRFDSMVYSKIKIRL